MKLVVIKYVFFVPNFWVSLHGNNTVQGEERGNTKGRCCHLAKTPNIRPWSGRHHTYTFLPYWITYCYSALVCISISWGYSLFIPVPARERFCTVWTILPNTLCELIYWRWSNKQVLLKQFYIITFSCRVYTDNVKL